MPRRPRPATPSSLASRRAGVALALAALAFAAQARIVRHEFVSIDDAKYISENPRVLEGLTASGVRWAFTTGYFSNWHPLTWLSHMLDIELFGPRPGGHHLMNLALHAVNTALLFTVWDYLVRVGRRRAGEPNDDPLLVWQSAAVAALFAVHPLHVESVAWASERKDTLSTLFWLLTLGAYGAYSARPSLARYGWVALALALGLMTKPMLVTMPAVLLLLDYWPLRRWQPRGATADAPGLPLGRLLVEKAPLAALGMASSVVTVLAQRGGGAVGDLATYPFAGRAWNAVLAYARYLGKTAWPRGMEFFYPYPGREFLARGWREPRLVAALALLVVLTAAAVWIGRRRRYALVGWLWFVGTLIPVIGLVQVGNQALADRYTYVPLIGLFVIAAWGLPEFWRWRRWPLGWLGLGAALLVALLAALSWRQAGVWRDSRTLYEHALRVDPANAMAHYNLGVLEAQERNFAAARERFADAVVHDPFKKQHHYNLGVELQRAGHSVPAADAFQRALELDPDYGLALHRLGLLRLGEGRVVEAESLLRRAAERSPESAVERLDHARALVRLERIDEALAELRRAVALDPKLARARAWLGITLARSRRSDEARRELEFALRAAPANPEPHLGLGDLAAEAEQWRQAVAHYRQAAQESVMAAEACRKIGEVALRVGETRDALQWLERSLQRNPYDPLAHWGYARALQAAGRADEAARESETALRLAAEQAASGSHVKLPH